MSLDLNDARRIFAEHLAKDPTRWRMDAALAHVVEWAYRRGMEDGKADAVDMPEALAKIRGAG